MGDKGAALFQELGGEEAFVDLSRYSSIAGIRMKSCLSICGPVRLNSFLVFFVTGVF